MAIPTPLARVNLGCGRKQLAGHVNVDRVADIGADVVHDLNVYPYPFADNSFDEICAYDVVEHLHDVVSFMSEVRRIARPGARVLLTTPHFSAANAFTDPTHLRQMSYFSFDYFTTGHEWNFYAGSGFTIVHRTIVFFPGMVNKLVHRLANRRPREYEQRWAWMFPAWFLYFELTVSKGG